MRFLVISAFVFMLVAGKTLAQSSDKISPQDYIDANEFARTFWAKLIKEKDVELVLKELAIPKFYECVDGKSFQFVRDDQIREETKVLLKRYYIAETKFLFLTLIIMQNNPPNGRGEDDPFSVFPRTVRQAITRSTWTAIDKNDSSFDADKPQSDNEASKYVMSVLRAFEKANPLLRRHAIKIRAGQTEIYRKNIAEIVAYNDYAFRPELSSRDHTCTTASKTNPFIIVDLPLFQLTLVRSGANLKIVEFVPHID